jgi:hypothetical protein
VIANRLLAWVSVLLSYATLWHASLHALSGESIPEMCHPSSVVSSEVSSSAPSGWNDHGVGGNRHNTNDI